MGVVDGALIVQLDKLGKHGYQSFITSDALAAASFLDQICKRDQRVLANQFCVVVSCESMPASDQLGQGLKKSKLITHQVPH
jgi:hypothetical protein